MKILLITEWFPPVRGAAAKRTEMMAEALKNAGHEVTVLTSFPSYPTGILPKKYAWKLWDRTQENGLDILRVWELPTANVGIIKRVLRELSFFLTSAMAALILPAFDAVIVSSPSFLSGLSGLAAKREGCKFYFDIRDLWPDSLSGLGVLKQGFALTLLEKLEKLYYRRAEKILLATPSQRKHLFLEGIPFAKTELLLNSANTDIFKPRKIKRPDGFKETDFVVAFIGNHSPIYDLENVLATARLLKDKKIKFLLVGEGESKLALLALAEKFKLSNVCFYSQKSLPEVAEILAWSNAGLISLANTKLAQESFPSKLAEYLAAGLPAIAAIDGDAKKLIEENQVGLIYEAGNPQSLAKTIEKLARNKNLARKMSQNARRLALKMFSSQTFAKQLEKLFIR